MSEDADRGVRALAGLSRAAGAAGRGLLAGAAGTAAMTASSTLEMKLRGRPPSRAPSAAAARALGVVPSDAAGEARFAAVAHAAAGIGLGAGRGLLAAAGAREPAASAAFLPVAWAPDLVVVPALGLAPAPWRWGAAELAISALHHAVYVAAASAAWAALERAEERWPAAPRATAAPAGAGSSSAPSGGRG